MVPASLARYVHLWQDIARAPLSADVAPLYNKVFLQVVAAGLRALSTRHCAAPQLLAIVLCLQ